MVVEIPTKWGKVGDESIRFCIFWAPVGEN